MMVVVWRDFMCEGTRHLIMLYSFARSVDDVYAVTEKLEKAGCAFQKKPDEGKPRLNSTRIVQHHLFNLDILICVFAIDTVNEL